MRLAAALIGSAALTLLAVGCGGSSAGHTGAPGPYGPRSSPAAVSRCMRANGVSGFPDPSAHPGGVGFDGLGMSNTGTIIADGVTFSGPVVQRAEKVCREYLPGGGGGPPRISASRKRQLLMNAACMRVHGVPSFPDPQFPPGGGLNLVFPPGVSIQSPAFQRAARTCGFEAGHGTFAVRL